MKFGKNLYSNLKAHTEKPRMRLTQRPFLSEMRIDFIEGHINFKVRLEIKD